MDMQRYGASGIFEYVIIPQSVEDAVVMQEVVALTEEHRRGWRENRAANALTKTLRYAEEVLQSREDNPHLQGAYPSGVVIPAGPQSQAMVRALNDVQMNMRDSYHSQQPTAVTSNDALVGKMFRLVDNALGF